MSPSFRQFAAVLFAVCITACASAPEYYSSASDNSPYFDSAFNDRNRAPASFAPTSMSDCDTKIDNMCMRERADYHYSVGEAFSLDGHRQKAIESFKMTLLYDPQASAVRLRLAAEYLKAGMVSEAIEQASEVTKKNPQNIEAHLLLGGLYSTMKLYPKAVESYEKVLKLDPNNTEAPLYLGAVYSEQKQHEKAIRYFESLAKKDFANPHLIHYYIGRVRMDQDGKKYEKEAEKAFKKSIELKHSFPEAVIALSALYSRQKKEKESVAILNEFQKNQGPNSRVAEILAQYYLENSQYDEAYEQLEYLEGTDDALAVKLKMALILIEKKIYDKAIKKLEEILADAPESDKIRFYLAAVYEETKQDEKAIGHYLKIGEESRFYSDSVVHASYLLKNQGKMQQSLALLKKALEKDKKAPPQVHSMYASLIEEGGDATQAMNIMKEAVKLYPEEAQVQFYYGTLLDKVGDKSQVIATMKEVLRINPNHVQGMNYLAYTWAEQNDNLEDAEKLVRKALKLEPHDAYIMDTLGWVLYKRGHFDDAAKVLEEAFKLQPTVGVIAEHLGDVYSKKTLSERALKMYNKALNLESDPKRIEEIKAKISSVDGQKNLDRVPATKAVRK